MSTSPQGEIRPTSALRIVDANHLDTEVHRLADELDTLANAVADYAEYAYANGSADLRKRLAFIARRVRAAHSRLAPCTEVARALWNDANAADMAGGAR